MIGVVLQWMLWASVIWCRFIDLKINSQRVSKTNHFPFNKVNCLRYSLCSTWLINTGCIRQFNPRRHILLRVDDNGVQCVYRFVMSCVSCEWGLPAECQWQWRAMCLLLSCVVCFLPMGRMGINVTDVSYFCIENNNFSAGERENRLTCAQYNSNLIYIQIQIYHHNETDRKHAWIYTTQSLIASLIRLFVNECYFCICPVMRRLTVWLQSL